MNKVLHVFSIAVIFLSCGKPENRTEYEKANWVDGTITSQEGDHEIFFHDCYCNQVKNKIILNHVYLGGMHGGHLTTIVANDSITFDMGYWPYDLWTFSFDKREVSFDNLKFQLGDTISGTLVMQGQSEDRNKKEVYAIDLHGKFKCVLKDSTYDHLKWYRDRLREQSESRLKQELRPIWANPDSIITELNLASLYINEIPAEIRGLKNIRKLDLSYNDISIIHFGVLVEFDSLKDLRLEGNNITQVSDSISLLEALEAFDLSSNLIDSLPKTIYDLTMLRDLDISNTGVKKLSGNIKYFKNMYKLDIKGTKIKHIPLELFGLPKLTELYLPDTVDLFSLENIHLPPLKKLRVSNEFLQFNRRHLKKLENLDTMIVRFIYKDTRQEGIWRYDNVRAFKDALPSTTIIEDNYVIDDN